MNGGGDGAAPGGISTWAALEFNLLVAGLGAIPWIVAALALAGISLPAPPDQWKWWYAPASLAAIVALLLLGLAVEGLAGLVENGIARRRWKWYSPCREDDKTWHPAQRWIWKSAQAWTDFGRRRVRILVARDTALNTFLFTIVLTVYFAVYKPGSWCISTPATLFAGLLLTSLFIYVWVNACAAFRRAVSDAGSPDAA